MVVMKLELLATQFMAQRCFQFQAKDGSYLIGQHRLFDLFT